MIHSLEFTENDEPIINGEVGVLVDEASETPTGESGGSRMVYLTSKYVFKRGGAKEARLKFARIAKKDRKHFATTVCADIDKDWVIQERVDCEPRMCTEAEWKVIEAICNKYKVKDVSWTSYKWENYDGSVRNTHNWIVDKTEIPVIFDYGED